VLRTTNEISSGFDEKRIVATSFCVYKGISKKYKGKYATGPFLLSLEPGWSN
jgi:hypothetical protein